MSPMYPTLERLYNDCKLNAMLLSNAVVKGWITEEEKQQIIAG